MARTILLLLLALLPSSIKITLYRALLDWKIGKGVRIGFSFLDARNVVIGDHVRVGHLNRFQRIPKLTIGAGTVIGNRNVFITAPPRYLADIREADPEINIGEECYIIGPHAFDIHAPLRLGSSVTLAGRGSSFYTHGLDYRRNCLCAEPIRIGENSYVGAHAQLVPGVSIAPNTIIGMGATVTKSFEQQFVLLGGNPARIVRELDPQAAWFTRNRPGRGERKESSQPSGSSGGHEHNTWVQEEA